MPRVLLVVLLVGAAIVPVPAGAKRAVTRAACLERCADATARCLTAAGEAVTAGLYRRCRRRNVRPCMRRGLDACPRVCATTPDLIGTWEGGEVSCTRYCVVEGRVEAGPCVGLPPSSFRLKVVRQGPACDFLAISEPFEAFGTLDVSSVPVTFEVRERSGVGIIHDKTVWGSLEPDGRLSVAVGSAPSASITPPFCSTTVRSGPMTRVAVD